MKSQANSCNKENVVARCRVILAELLLEREELRRDQQINRIIYSEKNNQNAALMLKAVDQAILDVASYIDEHSA